MHTSAVKMSRSCLLGTVISSSGTFAKRFATSPPETWSMKAACIDIPVSGDLQIQDLSGRLELVPGSTAISSGSQAKMAGILAIWEA